MHNQNRLLLRLALTLSFMVAVAVAGCATTTHPVANAVTPAGVPIPIPYVENCAVVSIGSPSKFACNGKVYTAPELARIREQVAKNTATIK